MSTKSTAAGIGGVETCARLMLGSPPSPLFVKGTWFPRSFRLSISDGLHCWTCNATEQAVAERAAGWDESVSEYLQRAQFYLSLQHPDSTYAFLADGENRKLSWTMEKHGTKLEGKWRCEKAKNDQEISCNILNFLMDSNVKLSDEVLRKTQSFERMKVEADKCLKQSEQFKNEKQQFETDIFRKFVAVLNSKKSKLRELRDKLARFEPAAKQSGDDEEETDDEESEADDSRTEGDDAKAATNVASEQANASKMSPTIHTSTAEETKPEAKESPGRQNPPPRQSPRRQSPRRPSPPPRQSPSLHGGAAGPSGEPSSGIIDSAAALLADSAYTSAPKRRRRL
ncbi:hypothetical protein GOP47_0023639 [Adiantum capillus-veneris]|uniref:DNA repair protein XRCC4 n=1 Tax=Adiantum capillus-veneris TaxID=13818 RepID=A0A9D4Z4N0_ADICA|nr:hypothetical protein GOP47_0023639 [Adiantum capillus-veneris]